MSRILTIGESMVLFASCDNNEINYDLIDTTIYKKYLAGAELNVSIGLSKLNHEVTYITKLGNDVLGKYILDSIKNYQIDYKYITLTNDYLTGFMMKNKVDYGDPKIAYFRKNSAAANIELSDINDLNILDYDLIYLSGIYPPLSNKSKIVFDEIFKRAKENNIPIVFDCNIREILWDNKDEMIDTLNYYAFNSTYFVPGIKEVIELSSFKNIDDITKYYLDNGVENLIIKLGEDGAFIANNKLKKYVRGYQVSHIVDTIGAGDGFVVGLIDGLLTTNDLLYAIKQGNAIGALAIQSAGDNTGYPNRNELINFMEGYKNEKIK
ncbi:MAG: sugar kinase [Bacilli bacterium]|nr:sugar kinase [Bacilli bacterium]